MSKIKTRKFPYFYTILTVLLIIAISAVAYGLSELEKWLTDYEACQPKYVAQEIFDTYFANPDIGAFIKEKEYSISPAESFDDLEKYVTDQIGSGVITYNETAGSIDGDTLKYVVSAGDYKFAQFTVIDSGERTKYNNPIYILGEYDFYYFVETKSQKIIAPSDVKVFVNGFELDESYCIDTVETESCLHMPSKILHNDNPAEGIKMSTYIIDGLLYKTDNIEVKDKYGNDCKVEKDDNGVFVADINYNSEFQKQYSERAILFAKSYAKYAQGCGSFSEFSKIMDSESSLHYKIKTLQNHFVHAHDTCEFIDEKATEFYEYALGVFSCRISFKWHAYRHNSPEAYEYIDMTLYFHEIDGEFKLYDMLTHSDFSK